MEHSSSSTLQRTQVMGTLPLYKTLQGNEAGFAVCWTELKQQPEKSKRMEEESIAADYSCLLFKWRNCRCIFLFFSIQYPTPFQSLLTWRGCIPFQRIFFSAQMAGALQNTWAGMGALSCAYAKAKGLCSSFGKSVRELPAASAHKCQEGKSRSENVCFKMVLDWLFGWW